MWMFLGMSTGAAFAMVVQCGAALAAGPSVDGAWARAPAGAAGSMAVYMTIRGGSAPDRLTAVDCSIAGMAMLHESVEQNGMSSMQMLDGVDVPAGGTVVLKPGGMHIMLEELHSRPMPGQTIQLSLHFAHGGEVVTIAPVRSPGTTGP